MKTTNEPVNPEKERVDKLREAHLDNVYDLTSVVLAECLGADMKYFDISYSARRIIQIIEEALPKVDLKDAGIEAVLKSSSLRVWPT